MASREFTDVHGRSWTVWEVQPHLAERRSGQPDWRPPPRRERRTTPTRPRVAVASRYESGWLVFETEGERRRLVPIPPRWDAARDDELELYCESATPTRRPRRLLD